MAAVFVLLVAAGSVRADARPLAQAARSGQYIVVLKDGASVQTAIASARSLGGDIVASYDHAILG
jgi:hypothetical protein